MITVLILNLKNYNLNHECSIYQLSVSLIVMSNDDESSDSRDSALFWVTLEFVIISSILPVLFLDRWSTRPSRSPNWKRTKYLMTWVFFSNILFQLISVLRHTACIDCPWITVILMDSRAILKGINLIFFIHRAKLVQGMSPVLSQKWFDRILPIIVAVIVFGFILVGTKVTFAAEFECTPYVDSSIFQRCGDNLKESNKFAGWFAILVDEILTSCLLVLFSVPLYRVYHLDLGVMNQNQLKQRRNLRNLLIWSMLLTFINQISSTFFFIPMVVDLNALESACVWGIGKFDPSINVWSSWLMVTRNRQCLKRICCCQFDSDISDRRALMDRIRTKHSQLSVEMSELGLTVE